MVGYSVKFSPWQQEVFDHALAAHLEGRLGHALLLVGPEQMGKSAVAEALAMRLLCKSPNQDRLACQHCCSCQLFAAKTHGDFQRVSFEPNDKGDKLRTEISVNQIRRLSEWFSLTSQLGGAQVAIIEPADAMNISASNALLKTLEEPAPNRFLLLVTSKPGQLLATLRSRCQRLEFRLPSSAVAKRWLQEQGFAADEMETALAAAHGHPGLAADWLSHGGLQIRREVQADLNAIGSGRMSPVELAQRWLADNQGELRLRFVAELVLEAGSRLLGVRPAAGDGLAAPADFLKLSAWFDALNRVRGQLQTPVRSDWVLAGLLHEWRILFE